jgi:hypothetical protein
MTQALVLLIVASCAAGCSYAITADKLALTSSARGVNAHIKTGDAEFRGELIEVRPEGLLILASSAAPAGQTPKPLLRVVPFTAIMSSTFEELGGAYSVGDGRVPQPAMRDRLRLVSRFPHGLAPELLRKLLESNGQTELAGVQR